MSGLLVNFVSGSLAYLMFGPAEHDRRSEARACLISGAVWAALAATLAL